MAKEEDKNFSEKDEVILSPTQQIRIKFKNNRLAMIMTSDKTNAA